MNDLKRKEIQESAAEFRENCEKSRYGIIDLFKDCNNKGYKLIRRPIGDNAGLGFTVKKDEDIVIFTNSSSRLSREMFTLAHEIGHAVLHINETRSFIDKNITIEENNDDEKEVEANYFAACLIMPEDKVSAFFQEGLSGKAQDDLTATDIARIMIEFNASFDMVLNRLENLKIIDADRKNCLDYEKTEKGVGNLLLSVGNDGRLNEATGKTQIPNEYMDYTIYNYNHNAIPQETLEAVLKYYNLKKEDVTDRLIQHPPEVDADELTIRGIKN